MRLKQILCIALMLSASTAVAQRAVESVDVLNARCEAARQQKLAPIRRAKIARCEQSANQPAAGCETFYSTYGDNSSHRNGSVVRGSFYDLPECVQARKQGGQLLRNQNF